MFYRFACVLGLALSWVAFATAAEKPNVVVILTDDQGWGDLSASGNRNLQTPRLDSLAKAGASLERFYVCPVCSPTRAEFLTGRYHPRGGVRGVTSGGERLDLSEKTLADALRAAGYATGGFGKWHNGSQYPYHPLGRGFQEFYGFCSGHWGDYFDAPLEHNGEPVTGRGFLADDITDHAIKLIDQQQQPFFCYLAFNTPHSPMQVPDRFYDKFKTAELPDRFHGPQKEDIAFTRAALAMCENIDWNVGRVLDKLAELKLADNTIVVYFCDNGPNSFRFNGGMKGRKGSTDEGGVRSPLFIRYPGKIAAGTKVKTIAGAIDLLPTLCELTGAQRVGDLPLDGISLVPSLTGQSTMQPERMLVSTWGNQVSARSQRYRLDAAGHLYDMVDDPGQTRDVAAKLPEVAAEHAAAVKRFKSDVLASKRDDRPFPVGYRELPLTMLPARDATFAGQVKRSARAPNCSFLTNWISKEDAIRWDVEVATAGKYEVVLYYTCGEQDLGAMVQLAASEHQLAGKLTVAHDPPLYGDNHDRVPRDSESLVKEFRPWKMGTIDLPAGRTSLELTATDIPGQQVCDVRLLSLRLLPKE